jgi:hypothetical protein
VTIAQRFAQVFGAVYLLVGIIGFIPPLLIGTVPGAIGPFAGFLIALFAVNWFHSLAHFLIGVAGLATYRSPAGASAYALILGVAYAALFVLGLIFGLRFLGGLLPLNGWDHALHLLTALIAFGVYFASRPGAARAA